MDSVPQEVLAQRLAAGPPLARNNTSRSTLKSGRSDGEEPRSVLFDDKDITDIEMGAAFEDGQHPAVVVRGPAFYFLGIIDVLQEWNYEKQLEHYAKVYVLQKDAEGISAVRPKDYAKRFELNVVKPFIEEGVEATTSLKTEAIGRAERCDLADGDESQALLPTGTAPRKMKTAASELQEMLASALGGSEDASLSTSTVMDSKLDAAKKEAQAAQQDALRRRAQLVLHSSDSTESEREAATDVIDQLRAARGGAAAQGGLAARGAVDLRRVQSAPSAAAGLLPASAPASAS